MVWEVFCASSSTLAAKSTPLHLPWSGISVFPAVRHQFIELWTFAFVPHFFSLADVTAVVGHSSLSRSSTKTSMKHHWLPAWVESLRGESDWFSQSSDHLIPSLLVLSSANSQPKRNWILTSSGTNELSASACSPYLGNMRGFLVWLVLSGPWWHFLLHWKLHERLQKEDFHKGEDFP